jgi:hypothetical protein
MTKSKKKTAEVRRPVMMLALSTIKSIFGGGPVELRFDGGCGTLTMRSPAAEACLRFEAETNVLDAPIVWDVQRFYALLDDPRSETAVFVEDETRHVVRVGRRRVSIARQADVRPPLDWAESTSFDRQFAPPQAKDVLAAFKEMAKPILDQEHPTLQSVHLTAKDGRFAVDGTDGFRVFSAAWTDEEAKELDVDLIVPGKVASVVGRGGGDKLDVAANDRTIVFQTRIREMSLLVRAALMDGKYPDLAKIKSAEPTSWYVIDRRPFLEMIAVHEAVAQRKLLEGRFRFEPEAIRVLSGHGTPNVVQTLLDGEDVLAAPPVPEMTVVGLRFGYVENAVEFLCAPEGAQTLAVGFAGVDAPVWFRQAPENRTTDGLELACVVAPIALDDETEFEGEEE